MCSHLYLHAHQHYPSLLAHSPNILKMSDSHSQYTRAINLPNCSPFFAFRWHKENGNSPPLLGQCEADVNQFLCLFSYCTKQRRHTENREGIWSGICVQLVLASWAIPGIDRYTDNLQAVFLLNVKVLSEIFRLLKVGLREHMFSSRLLDEFLLVILSLA